MLIKENKHIENVDFIYGYCSHIIADIQNNIKIWTPFLLENTEQLKKGMSTSYHEDSYNIDYALYLSSPHQKEIWKLLEVSIGYDIPNIVVADEINKMKHDILYSKYINRESIDVSLNKYVTLSRIQEFISEESQYIKNLLYKKH